MTFPYMVKVNGIYFNAGEEIPSELISGDSSTPVEEVKPETIAEVEKPKAKKSNTKKTE